MRTQRRTPALTALFVGAFLLSGSGAYGQEPDGTLLTGTEPEGKLLVGPDSTSLTLMGYCWVEDGQRKGCVDTFAMIRPPSELDLEVVKVAPGETLSVVFSIPSTASTIWRYGEDRFEPDPALDPSSFSAPSQSGVYYFAVLAELSSGEGMWMFKIQVGEVGAPS